MKTRKILSNALTPIFGLLMVPFAIIGFCIPFVIAGVKMGSKAYGKVVGYLYEEETKSERIKRIKKEIADYEKRFGDFNQKR